MPDKILPRAIHPLQAAGLLLLASSACRPVITIGWGEALLVILVAVFVLAPLLARLSKGVGKKGDQEQTRDDK